MERIVQVSSMSNGTGLELMIGNTPLHLALESGHGDAAVVLIEAGADRERVSGVVRKQARLTDRRMSMERHLRILRVLGRRSKREYGSI
jgi:hypothetical protein